MIAKILGGPSATASFVAVFSLYLSALSAHAGDNNKPCILGPDCPIRYVRLANQETDPFLFVGKLVNESHPRWKQYMRAIRRYPTVRDCLVENQKEKPTPNLLLFDWQRVGTGSGAEVCMFRILRSLGAVDGIEQWLSYHEFSFSEAKGVFGENYKPTDKLERVANLTGWWTLQQYRKVNPSLVAEITGFDLILSYQVVIGFSQVNEITGVSVVTPTK